MLPFFMNRQKYTDKTQMLKMDKSEGGVKKMAFWVAFFLMLPARVSCKKHGATILPEKHRNKCFFCLDECFFCVSQESSLNFSVWNSPTRSVVNGVIASINGRTLLVSASPFTTSFSWPTLFYPCLARKFGLQHSVLAQVLPNLSESRGGSAVLLQVLGNSQYQDRGLASEIY